VYPGHPQLPPQQQPQRAAVVSAPVNVMASAPAGAAMGQPTFIYQEFKCNSCDFRALRQADVELHKRSVHNEPLCKVARVGNGPGDKPFRCTICQYQCTSKASLDKHVHLVHKKERPFACQVCQRRFGQKVHLNVHMNAVHLKDRPFHCDECGYAAATKGLVQKHVSTVHRKEKPYACEICNSRFGQKVHMQKHVITVHMKEKPYKCDLCSYQTGSRGTLDRHIGVVHKGGSGGASKSSPGPKSHPNNKHIQSVHNSSQISSNSHQQFKCVECPMNFADMNGLRQHLSTSHIKVLNGVQLQLKIPQYYNL